MQGKAVAIISSAQTMSNLVVRSNSVLTSTATNNGIVNITAINATIEQGAQVTLDGRGFRKTPALASAN